VTRCCSLLSEFEVLGSLEAQLLLGLTLLTFQSKNDLTSSLGLLVEDGLGLSTESHLFRVVTSLSLCKVGSLSGLVLSNLVQGVLLALSSTVMVRSILLLLALFMVGGSAETSNLDFLAAVAATPRALGEDCPDPTSVECKAEEPSRWCRWFWLKCSDEYLYTWECKWWGCGGCHSKWDGSTMCASDRSLYCNGGGNQQCRP